ncbi:MAG: YbhB/YbcL family Raf kinase inhibitor-like protein [Thermofilaceae archaeon]
MRKYLLLITFIAIIVLAVFLAFFTAEKEVFIDDLKAEAKTNFELESPDFRYGEPIPATFTCDSSNEPPTLRWRGQPEGTVTYVLLMYDPDAPGGTFIHWVVYDIPGSVTEYQPGVGVNGLNHFGRKGYGGPCPPPGSTHRYFFVLFALDTKLNLSEGARLSDVLRAAKGHVLAVAETMGRYGRS